MAKVFGTIIFFLLFAFLPLIARAAALSISPSTGSFEAGNRVTVKIIATSNVSFNAVSGLVSFSPSVFSVESVSKAGSVLNFWITEPVVSKTKGTIKFEGVALGGFLGSSGTVVTINLRAVKAGLGKFSFQSGQILANDGEGTDITGNLIGASYSVKEATLKTVIPTEPIPALEAPQPPPSLKMPEIMLGEKYGARAILGASDYPKAQALLTFAASDGVKIFILGVADADGSFNLLIPNSLKRGAYTVTAVMIKDDKSNSGISNAILVEVGSIFSDVGWEARLLIILLILAVIYLILRAHFHLVKGGHMSGSVKGELRKTENIVHKSFNILREDVINYDNEKLINTKHKHTAEIKNDINEAEKIISKKIRDIESE